MRLLAIRLCLMFDGLAECRNHVLGPAVDSVLEDFVSLPVDHDVQPPGSIGLAAATAAAPVRRRGCEPAEVEPYLAGAADEVVLSAPPSQVARHGSALSCNA